MDWHELELFKGIDLNDSFVLGWSVDGDCLLFDIEASIWPESVHYSEPKENEYTCYKKALLAFRHVQSIKGLKPASAARSTVDPDGEVDYGNIDSLVISDAGFEIEGDFGFVVIQGGELTFEVHT